MGAGLVNLDVGAAVKEVGGFLGKILDKIAPDKMSEAEKEQHKLAFETQMEGYFTNLMVGFYDMVKAQMTAKVNVVVDTMRGLVRPVITFTAFGFYCWMKYLMVSALYGYFQAALEACKSAGEVVQIVGKFTQAAFTWYDFVILSCIITFWFGGRMIERYVSRAMDTEVGTAYSGGIPNKKGFLSKIFGRIL